MSIFSQAVRAIRAGKSPAAVWADSAAQIKTWEGQVVAKAPPALQPAITTAVAAVKQGASDAIAAAESHAAPLLISATDAASAAFTTAAKTYLGPISGPLSAASRDAIAKIRDTMIADLHAAALALEAELTSGSKPAE